MKEKNGRLFIPRPDAHAAERWCHLLSPVRVATRELLKRIQGTVKEVQRDWHDGHHGGLHQRYRARDDNIANCFLVYGDRGTGKSTVLLNAAEAVRIGSSFFVPEEGGRQDTDQGASDQRGVGVWEDDYECIKDLQDVVWLDILDLEPLPAKSNLLTILLTRVRNALDRPGLEASRMALTSRFEESAEGARQKLTHLISDASLVWEEIVENDTRIKANRQVVAADIYADFRGNFLSAMQELSKELSLRRGSRDSGSVIVLPIDNIDRSTEHLYGIVKLAQMVSCRQLLLVMAGDRLDVEGFLERAYWKELIQVGSGAGGVSKTGVEGEDEAFRMARRQSTAAAQKMLPQSHRVEVQRVGAQETLDFHLPGRTSGGSGVEERRQESIRDLFGKLTLHSGNICIGKKHENRKLTMLQLFDMDAMVVPEQNESAKMPTEDCAGAEMGTVDEKSSLTYAAEYGLRLPARGVVDLWQLAYWEAGGQHENPERDPKDDDIKAERIARTMLRNLIAESKLPNNLGQLLQEKVILRDARRKTILDFEWAKPTDQWVKRSVKIEQQYCFLSRGQNESDALTVGENQPIRTTLYLKQMKGVYLYVQDKSSFAEGHGKSKPKDLPPEVAAWLIVLHDIVRWAKDSSLIDFGTIPTAPWVKVVHEVPRDNPPGIYQVRLKWTAPDWGNFLSHDIFRKHWGSFLLQVKRADGDLDTELKEKMRGNEKELWRLLKQTQSIEIGFRMRLLLCGWLACVLETFFNLSVKARREVMKGISGLKPEADLGEHVAEFAKRSGGIDKVRQIEKRLAQIVTSLYKHICDLGAFSLGGGMLLPNRQTLYMRKWLEEELPLLLSPLYTPTVPGSEKDKAPLLHELSFLCPELKKAWLYHTPFIRAGVEKELSDQLRGTNPPSGDGVEKEQRVREILDQRFKPIWPFDPSGRLQHIDD